MDLEMFRGLVPFVTVAEEKSFRRAAARLGVSPAAVSKSVQLLEERVGLALLTRGGRAVELTREGADFFARCRQAVQAVEGAREALESARTQPSGELSVSAPFIAVPLLTPALALLRARFPKLELRVVVTDRLAKLGAESIDVAVRVGVVTEVSLLVRRLRATRLVTVASPGYVALHGAPKRLDDLARHECLSLVSPQGRPHAWRFASGERDVRAAVLVDHGPMLVDAALAGLGITQLFDFMADPLVGEGKLVRLLPDEIAVGPDVYAVCSPGRRAAARVRAAFDALATAFGASL